MSVVRMSQNLGCCMAYNLAMPYAFADGCDWVIWANNDVRIESNCLSESVEISQSDPKIGILGPAFLAWESDEPNYYMLGNHPYAIPTMETQSSKPIDVEGMEGFRLYLILPFRPFAGQFLIIAERPSDA